MFVEFGNHSAVQEGIDDRPKVTTVHFPEADESGLGGYSHAPGLSVDELKAHLVDAVALNQGITQLPDHEILVSLLHPIQGGWANHGVGKPEWVQVTPNELTPEGRADDLEQTLADYFRTQRAADYFRATDRDEIQVQKELAYWTKTPPGVVPAGLDLPTLEALYTDDGRVQDNNSNGGGQVGATGTGTAAGSGSFTSASTWVTNQWTGYKIVVANTAGALVWANIISNTNSASASVATIDRWYNFATPGGAAGTTPANGYFWAILDGGMTSAWFVGLATGANSPVHGDHTLATNGNAEITTGGGGLIRKIAPYAQTSGVASRSFTLIPVYTANGSDSLPATVTTIGVFTSMVTTFGGAGGPMKFETGLNASATLSASGDQLTVTETVTGS